ncbi:MAG: SpoIIE family protein phosphatase [Chloroflexota bacterium]
MTTQQPFWNRIFKRKPIAAEPVQVEPATKVDQLDFEMAPSDPLLAYFRERPGVVELDSLVFDSPALQILKDAGTVIVVPLMSQGELVGMVNLGQRLSEQEYSVDDKKLLSDLATHAAPAVRVAQLVQQQREEAVERNRIEQELKVARLIQQTLLPKEIPVISGWELSAYYQPAREVGGDFYDFLEFPDGRLALVIGDVTDKGVPAALVMSTTRTLIRTAAETLVEPGKVLEQVNNKLYPDIPARMFVTCMYCLLDSKSGRLQYANAGHDLPYLRTDTGVEELRATGMPLGLMPDMGYEEKEIILKAGHTVLFHSDGLAEAHNPQREMFGFPRLKASMFEHSGGAGLIDFFLEKLAQFTGPGWEQEDDVTLVKLRRTPIANHTNRINGTETMIPNQQWTPIGEFNLPSQPGNERQAMDRVAQLVTDAGLSVRQIDKLKTAVAEATMNAMEHGNRFVADRPVLIAMTRSADQIKVSITDFGEGSQTGSKETAESPDLEAKLAGEQTPRGWGLFLIKNMVDDMQVLEGNNMHTIELLINLETEFKL